MRASSTLARDRRARKRDHGTVSNVLIAGETGVLEQVRQHLLRRGHEPVLCRSGSECVERLIGDGADVIVLCLPVPGTTGADLLKKLTAIDRAANIVVCGTDHTVTGSTDAFNHGAFEYVDEPTADPHELLSAVGLGVGSRRGDVQLRYLRKKDAAGASWDTFVGSSTAMQEVYRVARLLCERSARGGAPTILVTGETGSGKGLLAKCIHYNGGRRTRPFVEVNCAAIPATLLESELFGHERGAFTDAHTARAGLFETANGGTLFLDEISSSSSAVQAKLLTAIEEKRVRRLGGRHPTLVDVQIIAATHANLKQAVRDGAFREDLYHRLNVVSLRVPPLRERGEDKILLAEAFIAQTCAVYGLPPRRLSPAARKYLLDYSWPGNVRELKNQVERVLLLYSEGTVEPEHLDARGSSIPPSSRGFRLSLPEDGVALEEIERQAIRRALDRCEGNVSQAARFLRISRQTLIYRMKKHGIGSPPERD